MERVTFLIEATGERIPCLLNPASILQARQAGVAPQRSLSGLFTGANHGDDPLLFTGGGTTELQLELLFDVSMITQPREVTDVRELTAPLWRLAENAEGTRGRARPPAARFLWGTSWNIPGVVAAVAERLEQFTAEGLPRRSWMRIRWLRVAEAAPPPPAVGAALPEHELIEEAAVEDVEGVELHEMTGGGHETDEVRAPGERLDEVADEAYGDPSLWRLLAAYNSIVDPLRIAAGTMLRVPPLTLLQRFR